MKLRKSFCNGRILINDIVRFWPLWGILFAGLQLMYTVPMFFYGLSYKKGQGVEVSRNDFLCEGAQKMYEAANPFVIAGFAILAAILVFGYLFQKKEAYMLHSLPVKRRVYFCSHFLAGLLMLIVPCLVTCLMLGGICGIFGGNLAGVMAGVMLEMLIMIVFFYTMACLVVMLCGNAAISVVIYIVANVLTAGLFLLVGMTSDFVLNEIVLPVAPSEMFDGLGNVIVSATPTINFREIMVTPRAVSQMKDSGMLEQGFRRSYSAGKIIENAVDMDMKELYHLPWQQVGAMAWYLIPAVLFVLLAYYLYRKRPLERVGDALAFPWGKPVFHFVFTICGSYMFAEIMYLFARQFLMQYEVTYRILFRAMMGCLFLGCILCFFISNMILQKSFRIWKNLSFAHLGICIVFALGMMAFLRYDCYHSNLPDGKEVRKLEMQTDNEGDIFSGTIIVERREDIDAILTVLQELYDRAEDMPISENVYYEPLLFRFDLGDGKDVELTVDYLKTEYFQKQHKNIFSVLNNPQTMIEKIFTRDYAKLQEDEYSMELLDETGASAGDTDNNKMDLHKKELLKALQADLETGKFTFGEILPGGVADNYLWISIRPREDGKGKGSGDRYESVYGDMKINVTMEFANFWRVYGELDLDVDK